MRTSVQYWTKPCTHLRIFNPVIFLKYAMKLPQIACFSLWGLTAFVAAGFALSLRAPALQPLNHMGDLEAVSYVQADIAKLFAKSSAVSTSDAVTTAPSTLRLQGIVFSNNAAQSRALIQTSHNTVQQFSLGSRLPNGGKLIEISKRQIIYDLDGAHQTLALPPT